MKLNIKIESALTPENAAAKNLIWETDIIYDKEAPAEANLDIKRYIEQGYVFGQCASSASINNLVGLYKKTISA